MCVYLIYLQALNTWIDWSYAPYTQHAIWQIWSQQKSKSTMAISRITTSKLKSNMWLPQVGAKTDQTIKQKTRKYKSVPCYANGYNQWPNTCQGNVLAAWMQNKLLPCRICILCAYVIFWNAAASAAKWVKCKPVVNAAHSRETGSGPTGNCRRRKMLYTNKPVTIYKWPAKVASHLIRPWPAALSDKATIIIWYSIITKQFLCSIHAR